MTLDNLLLRCLRSADLSVAISAAIQTGAERLLVDFGLTTDSFRQFTVWCPVQLVGPVADLDVAFREESDRDAARNFMDLAAADGLK